MMSSGDQTAPPGWSRQGVALLGVTGLAVAVWIVLTVANAPLRTGAAPQGIVSFELAATAERADAILASWGPRQREAASFGLGLDFLFLLLYPVAISLACRIVAGRIGPRYPRWALAGQVIALMVPLAVVLDAIENAALWRVLQLGSAGPWPMVAAVCAVPKFGLVLLGLGYALGTWGLARARP